MTTPVATPSGARISIVTSQRRRHEDFLLSVTFVLFILQSAVLNAAEAGFAALNLPGAEVAVAIIVYLPLMVALLSRFVRGGRIQVGTFAILYSALAFGFFLTAVTRPETVALMTDPGWPHNIFSYVFSPLSAIFAFLLVRLMDRPSLILKALILCAYVNFAYCLVRYAAFVVRGYWTGYSFTGEEARLTYSLGFGYDMLTSVSVFGLLIFLGPRRMLHAALTAASVGMIAIAGSRGPLLFAIITLAILLLYFGFTRAKTSPLAAAGLALGFAALTTITVAFSQIIDALSRTLESQGISSRSIQALASGDFGDDNGRSKIWEMATELITDGNLLGHGFYGERVVISQRFFWGYPHNLFLEFLTTFGPLVGTFLIIGFIVQLVRAFTRAPDEEHRLIILVFFVMILQLLLSNSYLLSPWFWGLLAVIQLSLRAADTRRHRGPTTGATAT